MIARSLPARFTPSGGWGNGEIRRRSPLGKNQWHNSATVRHWSAPSRGSSLSALPLAVGESPLMCSRSDKVLQGPGIGAVSHTCLAKHHMTLYSPSTLEKIITRYPDLPYNQLPCKQLVVEVKFDFRFQISNLDSLVPMCMLPLTAILVASVAMAASKCLQRSHMASKTKFHDLNCLCWHASLGSK